MTAHVKDNGVWKQLTGLLVKDNGTWKSVLKGFVKDNGAWKEFYAPAGGGGGGSYTVSLSPSPANGFTQLNNFNSQGYVSVAITATPGSGFTSPTYSWTRVSGASGQGAFSASGTSSATVTIGDTVPVFVDWQETWRCTVTQGANSASADVIVTLRCENQS